MKVVWRLTLVTIGGLLAWQIISLGLANHYAGPLDTTQDRNPKGALVWNSRQTKALLALAEGQSETEPDTAAANLRLALKGDPTRAHALVLLAGLEPESTASDALVTDALRMAPANPEILRDAGVYWLKRDVLPRAVDSFSRAMMADSAQAEQLNPVFLKLLENPQTRHLLIPLAKAPPPWWDRFFREVTKDAADLETVRSLFSMRKNGSSVPLSEVERQTYVERLRRDKQFTEAYLTWVNGLDETKRQMLGLLNNGSFEMEPSNRGYDWRLRASPNLVAETAETYGTVGDRALHLIFRGFDARFTNVSQDLFLDAGNYRLSGQARPDGLKSSGGLQWRVACEATGETKVLAESERFLGTSQWEIFTLDFTVPPDCEQPILRLIGAIRTAVDQRLEGSIWFDALSIRRLEAVPPEG